MKKLISIYYEQNAFPTTRYMLVKTSIKRSVKLRYRPLYVTKANLWWNSNNTNYYVDDKSFVFFPFFLPDHNLAKIATKDFLILQNAFM